MKYPADYYFTKEHEWVHLNGDTAFIGLTELAKQELQEILSIEIHKMGENLSADQAFGRIRSCRYLGKLVMPFAGKIIAVNEAYCSDPKLFNSCFDEEHWIVKVKLIEPVDRSRLLDQNSYKSYKANNYLHLVKYLLN
ncbi:glycine cleavage system protein H [Mucilaginibacter sp. 14171R-50]|uniref:glycine cleavage system protein H n=1 Tax=Mucilaginibacter sp. 14171R-50 TaxID=2703789 RepID=UPI00138B3F4C|nr:glycine cleavage system protein H [Mucilaginibacter sp. 14171R-50]QHS55962.1 glycine cleavage system protein H [Mucilaginibacter sp. 14171R-50]